MAVWTISAQAGTGGTEIGAALAEAAGVDLLDRRALAELARRLDPAFPEAVDDLEERVGGRLNLVALSMAMTTGLPDAFRELQLRKVLPSLGRAVVAEAARRPCVILASAGFAALAEHPSAVHVRVRAPFAWRVGAYRRTCVVDRRQAEKAIRHDDHVQQAWVRSLYHVDVDDPSRFSVVVDASRLATERIVDLLLAAGGCRPGTGPDEPV
ncbi:MAG TPA: cytidylate kinase-like family protein [Gaiellaceae bacterium]|nr:cytidylate kinase-like family protein [Gaiellaceae bacterium]